MLKLTLKSIAYNLSCFIHVLPIMDNFSITLQICFGLVHLLSIGLPLYVFNN